MDAPPIETIKIYHIVHVDNLQSVLQCGGLLSDAEVKRRGLAPRVIGLQNIKERRLRNPLPSAPGLMVGDCVPFYFCPRSVMLYFIHKNPALIDCQGGQAQVVHLVAGLAETIAWAKANQRRWAFTTSNAGSFYFESYGDLADLGKVKWQAVAANDWAGPELKEGKQAEFLLESFAPWASFTEIGVYSEAVKEQVAAILTGQSTAPRISVRPDWYY